MEGMVCDYLERLLEPCLPADFLASVWAKKHFYVRGWPGKFSPLLPWKQLNEILRRHRLDFPRLRLMRDGKSLPTSSYLRYASGGGSRKTPVPRLRSAELERHLREGATLVLDAVDELYRPLEELAEGLELTFRERVQINTYAGWRTSRGFDLHWDDHDVFILQVAGRKRWSVYGMTRPHPLVGDANVNPKPTGAPVWEETLEDGDLLYIPRGHWHVALPLDEPTLHLTVGIHNRTGLDLLGWLTGRLRASEIFRKDLPRFAGATERAAYLEDLRAELLNNWDASLLEGYLGELDESAEPRPRPGLPYAATDALLPPSTNAVVRLLAPRPLELHLNDGVIEFSCMKRKWRFAREAELILRPLAERRASTVSELCEAARGRLEEKRVLAFLRELAAHGLVAVEESQDEETDVRR
ncbi:MAG TPA: cupin domain-containing protein [Pyrinomonadaceae bacterium]|jgi:hypothetical protein